MEISFEKQVVLVTGAGRGLGASYAKMFAERGAAVVVNDAGVKRDGTGSDPKPASSVVNEIQSKGGTAIADMSNLSSESSCKTLIDNVMANFGRLDVLVHSAGLVAYKGIEDTTSEEWEQMRSVNIDAPFWLTRAVWPMMKRQKYGRIILTVSGHGLKTFDDSDVTAYGAGKGAQFGLMNGLASEGKKHGILVNAISPVAGTRIFRRERVANQYPPESAASGVVVLGSNVCPFTGKVLGAAGGKFTLSENQLIQENHLDPYTTPEEVLEAMK